MIIFVSKFLTFLDDVTFLRGYVRGNACGITVPPYNKNIENIWFRQF